MSKPIVIMGAGGHGKVLFDICRETGRDVGGFLDQNVEGEVHGLPVLGNDTMLDDAGFVSAHDFVLGIGNPALHKRLSALIVEKGGALATLVHPAATISQSVSLGSGCAVMAGVVINIDAQIGDNCIINTRASIDHDCRLGNDVQICPGATLAGVVECGDDVFVGAGATILPTVKIGARTVVGAGALVNRDIPADKTVVSRSFRFANGSSS